MCSIRKGMLFFKRDGECAGSYWFVGVKSCRRSAVSGTVLA